MKTANKKQSFDYNVLTAAIANAALSRRAALQIEMGVSLIHFTQEKGGTDTSGKANLKAVYHGAGYMCLAKADRDYKTVNRRLNGMAKLFDKLGSSLVNTWIKDHGDTEATLNYVVTELATYGFDTMDDVLEYVGVSTSRAPRQPKSGPVKEVAAANDDGEGEVTAPIPAGKVAGQKELDDMHAFLTANYGPELLREFCSKILVHVAEVETAQEQKAA